MAPSTGARVLVHQKPAGIAVLVTPWNYPAAMGARKIGPALAAGCPVVASNNVPDLPSCVKTAPLDDVEGWRNAISSPIKTGLQESVAKHHVDVITKQWGEIYDRIIDSRVSTE